MKKLVIPLILLVCAVSLMAGAPTEVWYTSTQESKTVDVDWKIDSVWEIIDSFVVAADDTAAVLITITGTAILDYNDKLYIGLSSAVAGATIASLPNLDTFILAPKFERGAQRRVAFSYGFQGADSLAGHGFPSGADTDTFYFVAACGGSTNKEAVVIEDLVMTMFLYDEILAAGGTVEEW